MMRKFFAALMVMLTGLAAYTIAGEITIRWENPTLNVDGSTILPTGPGSLAATILEYGACTATGAVPATPTTKRIEGSATTTDLTALVPGTEYCIRAYSENTYGQRSVASNTVRRQSPYPVPRAPVIQ